jgi:FAD/FMN-containing dehydrogenase
MCSALRLLRLPPFPDIPEPLRGRFTVQLCVAWPGDGQQGERLLAPIRAVAPAAVDLIGDLPYTQLDTVFQDPQHPVAAAENGLLLADLSDAAIDALLAEAGPEASTPLLAVTLQHLGGALARTPSVEDAVGARQGRYVLHTVGILQGPHAAEVPSAGAALVSAMTPWSTGGTFLNMHGTPGDDADRARAWPDRTYQRLRRAKRRYDPDALLRFGHSVPPAEDVLVEAASPHAES